MCSKNRKPGAANAGQKTKTFYNDNITFEIKNIDLVSLIQSQGVELKKSGSRYVGLCPFHSEKTPSFTVFQDNKFHCFGCGAHGDAATFIMESFNCSFPDALERLGLKKSNNNYSKTDIKKFQENKIKKSLVKAFRDWESRYSTKLGGLINSSHKKLSKIKTHDDLLQAAWIYPFLSQWEYHLEVLCYGSDEDKFNLFKEVRQ